MNNFVSLEGNVFNVKVRQVKSGDMISFTLSYYGGKDRDGKAVYGSLPVNVFGALADAWNGKLHDKDRVIVAGRMVANNWEKDGKRYYSTPINADSISRPEHVEWQGNNAGSTADDEEIPF